MIRPLGPADAAACDAIVASLPDWFGLAEGIRQAAEIVRHHEGYAAELDGTVIGFLTLDQRHGQSSEISWMAVHRDHRRTGVGAALLRRATQDLRARDVRVLVVKTLSDRIDPGPAYAQTRAFYLSEGFVPVLELDIWGPENPCQVLVLPL